MLTNLCNWALLNLLEPSRPSTPKPEHSPAANKVLSQAAVDAPPPLPTNGASPGDYVPKVPSFSRSNTPTPSLDGSTHSASSSKSGQSRGKKGIRNSTSALGLDKMIDEKRDARTMSERVVHIEVSSPC